MRRALDSGASLPPAIAQAPVPWEGAMPFWDAFWTLSAHRQVQVGFGIVVEQPISYEALSAYGKDHPAFAPGTAGFDVLRHVVVTLDREYRDIMAAKRTKEADQRAQAQRARQGLILP